METTDYAFTTTGLMGVGKTFARTRYGVQDLMKKPEGIWYTNFPLDVDKIVEVCAKRYKRSEEHFRKRIVIIPTSVINSWRDGSSGPWEYFDQGLDENDCHPERGRPLQRAHIAIDEAHGIVGKSQNRACIDKWQGWIAWIRHYGGRIEFVTQSRDQLHKSITDLVGTRLCVVNLEEERMRPTFWVGYKYGDVFQLLSKLFRQDMFWYDERVYRTVDGKEEITSQATYWRDPEIYQYYNSYNHHGGGQTLHVECKACGENWTESDGDTPQKQCVKCDSDNLKREAAGREKKPWEYYSYFGLLWWFFCRNSIRAVFHVGLFLLLLFSGQIVEAAPDLIDRAHLWVLGERAEKYLGSNKEKPGATPAASADPVDLRINAIRENSGLSELAEKEIRTLYDILKKSEEKIAEFINENTEVRAELEGLKNELGATFAVAMVRPDGVVFRGGYHYSVGEKIDFGPYEGRTLHRVDYSKRVVYLDDGTSLRLAFAGGLQNSETGEANNSGGTISSELRETASRNYGEPTPARVPGFNNDVSSGNAVSGFRSPRDGFGGGLDHHGKDTGSFSGVNRREESAGGQRSILRRSSSGSGGDSGGVTVLRGFSE